VTIENSFVEEYRAEVIATKQNMGSKFRNMTRRGTIKGKAAYWQTFGTFVAGTKTRLGDVAMQNPDHGTIKVDISDHYVGSMVDDLDMLKQNVDEMKSHASGHAFAMGRKEDQLIIKAMTDAAVAGQAENWGPGVNVAFLVRHMNTLVEKFHENEVPDDGRRYCAVSAPVWSAMLGFDEFANADFIGSTDLPYSGKGMTAKYWNGIMWFIENGLYRSNDGTTLIAPPLKAQPTFIADRTAFRNAEVHHCLAWHADDMGFDGQLEPRTTVSWENIKQSHSIVSAMACGAKVLGNDGVFGFMVDVNGAAAN
jgi:hypothetical protein